MLLVAPALAALTQALSISPTRETSPEAPREDAAQFSESLFYRETPLGLAFNREDRSSMLALLGGASDETSAEELATALDGNDGDDSVSFKTPFERWSLATALDAPTPGAEAPLVAFFPPAHVAPPPARLRPVLHAGDQVPMYDLWVKVLRDQPPPKQAQRYLPDLKRIFAEEGVPVEFAWLPEVESTFNPGALSSKGARGLFQFMPLTAREQGLRLRPHDERVNPLKSARAAAVLLRQLHEEFESWPLALAAYNAGGGRVRRTLQARDARTFSEIADQLPLETRLYVPKVLATLAVREGISPAALPAPRLANVEAGL